MAYSNNLNIESKLFMKEASVINAPKISPSVSLIIPTDKSYPQYRIDEGRMKSLLKQVEKELQNEFSADKSKIVITKLQHIVSTIDHHRLSKALAIFVSPEKEKMYYLPFPVQEKLIIDTSFEVRDMLYSAKNNIDYLLLVIVNHKAKVYHGYNNSLVEIEIKDMPLNIEKVKRDYPEKVANFSDLHALEEINLDRYLREIDDVLTGILKEINAPVIICGVKRSIGHFKKLTKNRKKIVDYVEGSYGNSSKEEIYNAIESTILKLREKDQQNSIDKLEEAVNKKEYVYGIENVWRAAKEQKGRLLIVEKNFVSPAKIGKDKNALITDMPDKNDPDIVPDIVDDIIEMVLKYDGDVSFVNDGKLTDYKRIALVTRY